MIPMKVSRSNGLRMALQTEFDGILSTPRGAILGQLDVELHPREHRLQEHADRQVVVDDEDSPSGTVELM